MIRRFSLVTFLIVASGAVFPSQEMPWFFIQLSDPQFGMFSGNRGFEQETANYEFAIATARRLKPAFVIVTGDLVNQPGDSGQIAEYLRISGLLPPSIPLYHVAGNHDVGNDPTPETLAAYRKHFGRDYYGFRAGPVYGIVLNSALFQSQKAPPKETETQERWLERELETARGSGARHIVVFQHHPYMVKSAGEPDEYHNVPGDRRRAYMDLLRRYGVRWVFAGHYHQNAVARDGDVEVVTTGPVGNPLGRGRSGIRIVSVRESGLVHRYFDFGELPAGLADAFR